MRQTDPFDPSKQSASFSPHAGTTVDRIPPPSWVGEPGAPGQEPEPAPNAGPRRRPHLRRYGPLYLGILIVLLLVFVPPLVNIGRYQRGIAISIGNSIGRPVHFSNVSLTVLPLPGFTIEDLIVGEDPAFGSEPIIRSNEVHVTLRISSLWRRQVEFSSISFTDPSVNLVHAPNGRWNIEGILLQASRIETAPTAQQHAGPAPRFPYIEATGARLNFKQEQEKLPFSLTDADFALWLPDPHQWHFRLRGHPDRTDADVTDTGTVELEATLGAGPSLSQVPLDLEGQWRDAQLGEASRVLFGHDAGWRGQMNLTTHIRGTFGESAVTSRLRFIDSRPADFVPEKTLSVEADCFATASGLFHAFEDIRCSWPPVSSSLKTPTIALTGTIPNVHHLGESSLQLGTTGIPASTLISWLRSTTPHVPEDLAATGILTGSFTYEPGSAPALKAIRNGAASAQTTGHWQGQLTLKDATLTGPAAKDTAVTLLSSDVHFQFADRAAAPKRHGASAQTKTPSHGLFLVSTPLLLGGREPAVIEGHFDSTGYTLHLSGGVTQGRLQELARALPPLGDGLVAALPEIRPATGPFHIDLTATRPWRGQQTWRQTFPQPAPPRHFLRASR